MSPLTPPSSGTAPTPKAKAKAKALRADQDAQAARLALALRKLKGIQEIGQILASDSNLNRVLEEIIQRTTALMEADRSTLYLLSDDGRTLWSKNTHGGEVKTIELTVGHGIAGWVALHGQTVNVKDAYRDHRFDSATDALSGYHTESILCQPLRDTQKRIVGVIQVLNKADGYFTTDDEEMLSAIASQAAVCVQNSRLYRDVVTKNIDLLDTQLKLQERTSEVELLFQVERAAATARSIQDALDGALAATFDEYPCGAAAIALHDPTKDCFEFVAACGPESDWLAGQSVGVKDTIPGEVFQSCEPWLIAPMQQELRDRLGAQPPASFVLSNGICLPIRHPDGPLGCMLLVNRTKDPRGFDKRDVRLLGMIASRIALSIVLSRAQDEELKAERMAAIGGMLSSVVHDLRTPLTIITGYTRLIAREEDREEREGYRTLVKKQVAQIQNMTKELLAFARGETQILMRRVFVREFLDEIGELLREEFSGSGVELVMAPEYTGGVRIDDGKMKRVVYNLARNALEAMRGRDGARFEIRVSERDALVFFDFIDNGPGIPREMEGRLFDSFATFGKANGTGLGLAIVKKIVDEHGGTLDVTSERGKGTTFSIGLSKA